MIQIKKEHPDLKVEAVLKEGRPSATITDFAENARAKKVICKETDRVIWSSGVEFTTEPTLESVEPKSGYGSSQYGMLYAYSKY